MTDVAPQKRVLPARERRESAAKRQASSPIPAPKPATPKKKGAPEVSSNNPDQKSMQKLGHCTLTIEPHTFDAVIYTVRDPNGPPPVYYRHPNQYPQQPPPPHLQNHYPAIPAPPPQQNV